MSRSRWPGDPRAYRWLVDGHNAIFAHPRLEAYQTGDDRAEARRLLEAMLERFAAEHALQITVVYDGNRIEANPDARHRGPVLSQYSNPPEEADDRILYLAARSVRHHEKVAVVTSDRALAARLPSGSLCVEPAELFRRLRRRSPSEKGTDRPPGDFSDVEAHFLAIEPGDPPQGRKGSEGARGGWVRAVPERRSASEAERPAPAGAGGARDTEALDRKRARGRRKQERRLARAAQGKGKRRRRCR